MPHNLANVTAKDVETIKRASGGLRVLSADLKRLFPEREWFIQQLILGLITGRNVMVLGTFGTAKSLLIQTLLSCIKGPCLDGSPLEVFTIQMESETRTEDLIGPPNIPLLEKQGVLEHFIQGYLPTANLAVFEEFLDAAHLVRTLLDVLNEKVLQAGRQTVQVPLLFAIAATNRSPEEIMQMLPWLQLEAVIDRFLFVAEVEYLQEDVSVLTMLKHYVLSARPKATVKFSDIQQLATILNNTNQFPGESFLEVYERVMHEYRRELRAKTKSDLSDRRVAWLTQAVEAEAILHGRANLLFDDIFAAGLGVARGKDTQEFELFLRVATPIIEKAKTAVGEHVDEAERAQLERIGEDLHKIEVAINNPDWPATSADAGADLQKLRGLERELLGIHLQLGTSEQIREQLLEDVSRLQDELVDRI